MAAGDGETPKTTGATANLLRLQKLKAESRIKYAHYTQPRKNPTNPPSCPKKEENHSPRAEKCGRLRGKNGRSTPKKEESERARGGERLKRPQQRKKMAAPRPPDGGGRAIREERLRPPRLTRLLKTAAVNDAHKSPPPKLVPEGEKLG